MHSVLKPIWLILLIEENSFNLPSSPVSLLWYWPVGSLQIRHKIRHFPKTCRNVLYWVNYFNSHRVLQSWSFLAPRDDFNWVLNLDLRFKPPAFWLERVGPRVRVQFQLRRRSEVSEWTNSWRFPILLTPFLGFSWKETCDVAGQFPGALDFQDIPGRKEGTRRRLEGERKA